MSDTLGGQAWGIRSIYLWFHTDQLYDLDSIN